MRKVIFSLSCALLLLCPVTRADEGMWLLPLLEKINAGTMHNLGSRLTPEQIYSVNNSSIKDAIVQFGGGCTGEIISDKGLLITNHHCGYSYIQSLSTEEHNYLEDGFWAESIGEELPVPGLTVKFLQSMEDVTDKAKTEDAREKLLAKAKENHPGCRVELVSFFNENVYYIVVSKIYRDVRFVGAPPAASGKFGGDTDNWMWPRHTCDFSMFRVYADKNNEPADYSEDNVPFEPRRFLSISLKGVDEGDFVMVMGYPGSTQRYQTAAQLESMLATNRIRIDARTVRQEVLWAEMRADEKISLQYASKYASSSNGWKKWQGMEEAFAKLQVIERQKEKEAQLEQWIDAKNARKKKYAGAIEEIAACVAERQPYTEALTLLSETLMRIELLSLTRGSERGYKNYNADVDRKAAIAVTEFYLANVKEGDKVDGVSVEAVEKMFDESAYTSLEKLEAAKAAGVDLEEDPAKQFAHKVFGKSMQLASARADFDNGFDELARKYAAALMEWNSGEDLYPDANMTCRLTYGTVKGYEPRDGVVYKHYTTLKGVIEKEKPGVYEFRVPEKLKEIYYSGDYGQYANADGELVTCFLSNLDITGGNSGSPVMDADGNLVGLAFDGNWEAMSGDVIFEPELQRCIAVDIRYCLMMMDKFGGAGYLLDEMDIVK